MSSEDQGFRSAPAKGDAVGDSTVPSGQGGSADSERDGFEIVNGDGRVIHFVACTKDSERMRERVLLGLLRNLHEDYTVRDTRDGAA